ncbi:SGNH/GDSL hydrolase family protein [Lacimonas salitolerans]|uniref:SGNH/GDSL hydrolase family protein n=1 Tax=Lacimonas salitolerans TaxID=1323750 RepID=A0ABW4EG87_9RHOB
MPTAYVKYALAPVLALQGLALRRGGPRLPEPPGPRQGIAGTGPMLRLLIAGDSSAAGVGAAHQEQALSGHLVAGLARQSRVHWRLEAQSGDTTAACLRRLHGLAPARFDLAVLALGVNDVTSGLPRRIWLHRQRALHALLRHKFGVRRIYASGLPPMGAFPSLTGPLKWIMGAEAARFDAALAELAARTPDLCHVPFDQPMDTALMASDGFHPGPQVYARWAGVLTDRILTDRTIKGDQA